MQYRLSLALKILAWLAALLGALVLVLVLGVALFDWNQAKPWATRQLSIFLDRSVGVGGDLQLSWATGPTGESGAMRFLPRLRLIAHDVFIGNAKWADSGDHLARAALLDMSFSPIPLLYKHWLITDMRLTRADVVMERGADKRKNWRFSQDEQPRWSFDIRRLEFDQVDVRYVDRIVDIDMGFHLVPLSRDPHGVRKNDVPDFAVAATLSGRYGKAPVQAKGQGGALLDLLNDGSLYPVRAEGEIGKVHTVIDGSFTNPHRLVRADLQLTLSGDSFADLYPSTGVPLPATRAFHIKGALAILRGDAQSTVWDWRYQRFSGTVGESDFSGDAQYLKGPPKDQLRAQVHSGLLRLSDLTPPAGRGQNRAGKKPGRILPSHELQPERWGKLDAELIVDAKRFELLPKVEWQDALAEIHLKDRVLSASPLRFDMAGGKGEGAATLDARQDRIRTRLQLAARGLQVRQLFPGLTAMHASFGKIDGDVDLSGAGNSVAEMLANSDGRIKAEVSQGSISQFILEAAGLNLADAVFAKMYRDKQVRLNCAAGEIDVRHGQADIRRFTLNTEDAAIDVNGKIDLAQEALDLDILPRNKHLRILSLRTPLYVKGSFAHPEIGARSGPLAAKAGAAAALALVAPVAAVIPLITPGQEIPDDCAPRADTGAAAKSGQ